MLEDGIIGAIALDEGALVLGLRISGKRRGEREGGQGEGRRDELGREAHIEGNRRSKNGLKKDTCLFEKTKAEDLLYREGCWTGMHLDRRRRRTSEEGGMCFREYMIRVINRQSEGEGTLGRARSISKQVNVNVIIIIVTVNYCIIVGRRIE